jgi:hypothetical protein
MTIWHLKGEGGLYLDLKDTKTNYNLTVQFITGNFGKIWRKSINFLLGTLWSWSYGIWIYNYLCNLAPITTKVVSSDPVHGKVYSMQHYVIKCQWLMISSTNKTDHHDKTAILLKLVLNPNPNPQLFMSPTNILVFHEKNLWHGGVGEGWSFCYKC